VPKPFPKEFREDVIRVYRHSDASMAQVAKDFGTSASCLKRWLTIDERKSVTLSSGRPGMSPTHCAGPTKGSSCSSRRMRSCAVLRRICRRLICRENDVPARPRAGRRQGSVAVTWRVLKIARPPYYRWLVNPVTDAELTTGGRANALFDAPATTRSSATGSWSMRPVKQVS
jgi:hypothetical protein